MTCSPQGARSCRSKPSPSLAAAADGARCSSPCLSVAAVICCTAQYNTFPGRLCSRPAKRGAAKSSAPKRSELAAIPSARIKAHDCSGCYCAVSAPATAAAVPGCCCARPRQRLPALRRGLPPPACLLQQNPGVHLRLTHIPTCQLGSHATCVSPTPHQVGPSQPARPAASPPLGPVLSRHACPPGHVQVWEEPRGAGSPHAQPAVHGRCGAVSAVLQLVLGPPPPPRFEERNRLPPS